MEDIEVEIGSNHNVIIDKVYGPAAFDNLRIHCDTLTWEWVIEQNRHIGDIEHEDYIEECREWIECCRIPACIEPDDNTKEERHMATLYRKTALVEAVQATEAGRIETPEGVMTYDAGDYIVTNPKDGHSWPVKKAVFEDTYEVVEGQNP